MESKLVPDRYHLGNIRQSNVHPGSGVGEVILWYSDQQASGGRLFPGCERIDVIDLFADVYSISGAGADMTMQLYTSKDASPLPTDGLTGAPWELQLQWPDALKVPESSNFVYRHYRHENGEPLLTLFPEAEGGLQDGLTEPQPFIYVKVQPLFGAAPTVEAYRYGAICKVFRSDDLG